MYWGAWYGGAPVLYFPPSLPEWKLSANTRQSLLNLLLEKELVEARITLLRDLTCPLSVEVELHDANMWAPTIRTVMRHQRPPSGDEREIDLNPGVVARNALEEQLQASSFNRLHDVGAFTVAESALHGCPFAQVLP